MTQPESLPKTVALGERLRWISQLTLGLAVGVISVVIIASSFVQGLMALKDTSREQARMLADSATAAMAFGDQKAALELLQPLRNLPQVLDASVVLTDGKVLARFQRDDEALNPGSMPPDQRDVIGMRWVDAMVPVAFENQQRGFVTLRVSLTNLYRQTLWQLLWAGLAVALAMWGSVRWVKRLNASVLKPLYERKELTARIAVDPHDELRAAPSHITEMPTLAQGFNAMLGQIQQRDASLDAHREHLEEQVELRTLELRAAKELAEAANKAKSEFLAKPYVQAQLLQIMAEHAPGASMPLRSLPQSPVADSVMAVPLLADEVEPAINPRTIASLRELDPEGQVGLVSEVLRLFLVLAGEALSRIEEPLGRGDLQAVGRAAHALRSGAMNVGADRLAVVYREFEGLVRNGQRQVACDLLPRFKAELAAAVSAAAAIVAESDAQALTSESAR